MVNGKIEILEGVVVVHHSDGVRRAAITADKLYELLAGLNTNPCKEYGHHMLPDLRSVDGDYGERCSQCSKTDTQIMNEENK